MDGGTIQETGHPAELLSHPGGAFSRLVDQGGPSMAAHLRAIADAAFQ